MIYGIFRILFAPAYKSCSFHDPKGIKFNSQEQGPDESTHFLRDIGPTVRADTSPVRKKAPRKRIRLPGWVLVLGTSACGP